MSRALHPIRAGFIPLVDAAILIAAADRGFAAEEGVALELVREVSWANMRDKLSLGHFDAAHVLAPLPIAASLGLDYARVPMCVPLALNLNGNSIVVATALAAEIERHMAAPSDDPVRTGAALRAVVDARRRAGAEPPTFAMTFPFSTHNYQLRLWMAAAGVDPDRDVRLVVLPPPYMVDSLASGHVQGFCVGAPWPSLAVEAGLGSILHLGTDIVATCPEKVLALRTAWADANPDGLHRLLRALLRAAGWCARPENRRELAELLTAPGRIEVAPAIVRRALDGRLKVTPDGRMREDGRYLVLDPQHALRPDRTHAAWLYAQMARWRQADVSPAQAEAAAAVYRPELFDAASQSLATEPAVPDGLGAFVGPPFDPDDIPAHLAAWTIGARAG